MEALEKTSGITIPAAPQIKTGTEVRPETSAKAEDKTKKTKTKAEIKTEVIAKPEVAIELLLAQACSVEKVAVCVDGDVLHVKTGKTELYLASKKKKNGAGRVHYTLREYAEKDRAIIHLGGLKTKSS